MRSGDTERRGIRIPPPRAGIHQNRRIGLRVTALRQPQACLQDDALFNEKERATIRLTIEMTRNVQVADSTLDAMRANLSSDQLLVELVGVIATYNMVSRFLVALGIEPE